MPIELPLLPMLLIILLAAGVGRLFSKWFGQSVILGELVFGAILGSFVAFSFEGGISHEPLFSVIEISDPETVFHLADIGILFLLFSIGLDLDLERFKELALPAGEVAVSGVILPFALGYGVAILFGFSPLVGSFLGASLVATSVGISASLLREAGELQTRLGTLIMGSAVADDVLGIIIMSVLFSFATTGSLPLIHTVLLVVLAVLFFVIPLSIGTKALRSISERVALGRENLLIVGLVILFFFSFVAEKIELAPLTGAFVAGLVLGQTHFAKTLQNSVSLIGGSFFVPFFFTTMGMKFDLHAFASVSTFAIVLIVLGIVGKVVGCTLGAKISNFTNWESLSTGLAMVPRAEVALVVGSFGFKHGILEADVLSAIIAVVIVTSLFTPPLLWRILKGERRAVPA